MKKLFLVLLLGIIGLASHAQMYRFQTTEFAIKYHYSYGWGSWSDWESSHMLLTIDLDTDEIVIYSPTRQYLVVTSYDGEYTDASGGENIVYRAYDKVDKCYCEVRLRMELNGNSQVYLTYSNVIYVYNVKRL